MAQVFISHSSRDNAIAKEMKAWLSSRGFNNTFLDIDKHAGIPPGADWERHLYRMIEACQAVILIATPNWHDSKWCFVEFAQARALGKPIFPLIVAATGDRFIAPDIQQLDLRQDRDGGLDRLAQELTRIALDAQAGFSWDSRRPPYPGLMAFESADAAVFFGRDEEIRRVIERLNARRVQGGAKVIVLLGASGSGKSSVIRAGVLPRLARDGQTWMALRPCRPRRQPITEMAKAAADALGDPEEPLRWRETLSSAHAARRLADLAESLRVRLKAPEANLLITVDQGEELFTTAEEGETSRVLAVFGDLPAEAPILVLLALRSDFLGRLQTAAPELRFEEISLPPFPLARIRQIIDGPAQVAGVVIDDEVVASAVGDAATEDALPLLAFTLRELHDRFIPDRDRGTGVEPRVTLEHYRSLGDVATGLNPIENAVRKRADEVIEDARLSAIELDALRQTFVGALVRLDDAGQYLRRPAVWKEVPADAKPVLEKLAQARLLVLRGTGDAVTIEVAHEAMIRKWPRLRAWLDAERDFIVGKTQLGYALTDWKSAARQEGALLRGLLLSRARQWLRDHPSALSPDEREFIGQSAALDVRETRKRSIRRWGARAAAVLGLVLIIIVGFFFREQRAASVRAEAAELAAQARSSLSSGDANGAGLLAARAFKLHSSVETRSVLLETVLAISPFLAKTRKISGLKASTLAWAPDSATVAVFSERTVIPWRPFAGPPPPSEREIAVPSSLLASAWAPTGLAVVSADGAMADIAIDGDGAVVARAGTNAELAKAAFSEASSRLLLAFSAEPDIVWLECRRPAATVAARCAKTRLSSGYATAVALDAAGTTAAIGFDGGKIGIIALGEDRFETSREISNAGGVLSLGWTRDGERLAVGTAGGRTFILDRGGDVTAEVPGNGDAVTALAWSPSGRELATACDRSVICVWRSGDQQGHGEAFQLIAYLAGHRDVVRTIAWSPDGRWIASASTDSTVRVWSPEVADHTVFALDAGEYVALTALDISADRSWLAAGDDRGNLHIWPADGRKPPIKASGGRSVRIDTLAWSPTATRLAIGDADRRLSILDPLDPPTWSTLAEGANDIGAMVWLPDGAILLEGGGLDGSILAHARGGHAVQWFEPRHPEAVTGLAIDAQGGRLLSADALGNVWRWDLATRARLEPSFPSSGKSRDTIWTSPDGRRFLVAGNDGDVVVYEADHPMVPPRRCISGSQQLDSAAFALDGRTVVAVSNDQILHFWSLTDGCELLSSAPLPLLIGQRPGEAKWPRYRRHLRVLPEFDAVGITLSTRSLIVVSRDPEKWHERARTVANAPSD